MNHIVDVSVKIIRSSAKDFGFYATPGSAGMDLKACCKGGRLIAHPFGEAVLVNTGIAIHMADPSMCAYILPRSGIGHRDGIILGNGTGLIDSDYQGELKVSIWNRGKFPFEINHGDRIAQLVFMPVLQARFQVVDEFADSERGVGGFGSTGA